MTAVIGQSLFRPTGKRVKVDILQLLKNMQLSNLQRKQVDGKALSPSILRRKPNAVLEKTLSYLSKIEGQILIDETDKRIIRVEGFAPGEFARTKRTKPKPNGRRKWFFSFRRRRLPKVSGFRKPSGLISPNIPKSLKQSRFNSISAAIKKRVLT